VKSGFEPGFYSGPDEFWCRADGRMRQLVGLVQAVHRFIKEDVVPVLEGTVRNMPDARDGQVGEVVTPLVDHRERTQWQNSVRRIVHCKTKKVSVLSEMQKLEPTRESSSRCKHHIANGVSDPHDRV